MKWSTSYISFQNVILIISFTTICSSHFFLPHGRVKVNLAYTRKYFHNCQQKKYISMEPWWNLYTIWHNIRKRRNFRLHLGSKSINTFSFQFDPVMVAIDEITGKCRISNYLEFIVNTDIRIFLTAFCFFTRYRALYKYRPQNDDELELLEGDTVYVLEKCDDGWYVGSSDRTGAFGTFPGNYVERV